MTLIEAFQRLRANLSLHVYALAYCTLDLCHV